MEFQEPKPITQDMRMGLARMYADVSMREYLIRAIAVAKNNAIELIKLAENEKARDYVSRASSLEQLLEKGKEHFIHFEKVGETSKMMTSYAKNEIKKTSSLSA